jgi:hypothetical protein
MNLAVPVVGMHESMESLGVGRDLLSWPVATHVGVAAPGVALTGFRIQDSVHAIVHGLVLVARLIVERATGGALCKHANDSHGSGQAGLAVADSQSVNRRVVHASANGEHARRHLAGGHLIAQPPGEIAAQDTRRHGETVQVSPWGTKGKDPNLEMQCSERIRDSTEPITDWRFRIRCAPLFEADHLNVTLTSQHAHAHPQRLPLDGNVDAGRADAKPCDHELVQELG